MKKYMIMTDLFISDKKERKWFVGVSEESLRINNGIAETYKNPKTAHHRMKYKKFKNNPFFIDKLRYIDLENYSYNLEEATRLLNLYKKIHKKESFDTFLMKITKVKNLLDSSL